MSSSVYCNDVFQQLHRMFHTLTWESATKHNIIQFYRKHYELEMFEIEISQKYIYITIPVVHVQINYCKKFFLQQFCDAMKFLEFHIDNYVKNIINNNELYHQDMPLSNNNHEQLYINNLIPKKQFIICSS